MTHVAEEVTDASLFGLAGVVEDVKLGAANAEIKNSDDDLAGSGNRAIKLDQLQVANRRVPGSHVSAGVDALNFHHAGCHVANLLQVAGSNWLDPVLRSMYLGLSV
jgi:hypothetical protein